VRIQFLLGPAGSGKTHRCLEEIREMLANPEGGELLFLAPRQATFELERRLLATGEIRGFTRLRILSFERFAKRVLLEGDPRSRQVLSEGGRLMVLRSILGKCRGELRQFHGSARLPGFVREVNDTLRELRRARISPEKMFALASAPSQDPALAAKLHDLAMLAERYEAWLEENHLADPDSLLDRATEKLRTKSEMAWDGVWLDGFAELSPQERELVATLAPRCRRMTLAFCLDDAETASWSSPWAAVAETVKATEARLAGIAGMEISRESFPKQKQTTRFRETALAELERRFARASRTAKAAKGDETIRLVQCATPEAELIEAAREILRHVKSGGRFRECAVLARTLDTHADVTRRIFARYEIPYFIDRRERIGHHPLAELTRYGLRVAAYGWRAEDWFGALKTGLVSEDDFTIARLENLALQHGWRGERWFESIEEYDGSLERFRMKILPPFRKLADRLKSSQFQPTGAEIAEAVREFWELVDAAETLEAWTTRTTSGPLAGAVHATVWDEMNAWLDNVALAFSSERLPISEWMVVLDFGLAELSVGAVPPALDQVLVGAVDRSRNPELELAIVVGLNETQFPVSPPLHAVLTEAERLRLEGENVFLPGNRGLWVSRERFLAYIAFTRAGCRLVITFAQADSRGAGISPSPLIEEIQGMFPDLQFSSGDESGGTILHPNEAFERLIENPGMALPAALGEDARWREWFEHYTCYRSVSGNGMLPAGVAERLYGPVLKTSVSLLEQFAACPFRFFVASGLRAEERRGFELDARERGSFQHAILARFHEQLTSEGKRWREITPVEARSRVEVIGREIAAEYRGGLLESEVSNEFSAAMAVLSLGEFVSQAVAWMAQNEFDPAHVELGFGRDDSKLPALEVDLEEGHRLALRGVIDRIDFAEVAGETWAMVLDYKSGARELDPLLLNTGLQLQLPAYLAALVFSAPAAALFGKKTLRPAGIFYVNLRGALKPAADRNEALTSAETGTSEAYQHLGRFDQALLERMDRRGAAVGDQFRYRRRADGEFYSNCVDPVSSEELGEILKKTWGELKRIGRGIYSGVIQIDPYQRGAERACDRCLHRPICRVDFWTHRFRTLRVEASGEAGTGGANSTGRS
jgi:ATP-dependent helicase/nuclease subunit B